MISFRTTSGERDLFERIATRAELLAKRQGTRNFDRVACIMDLTACHANGCRLDLDRLISADDFNFSHDIAGIGRHLNRETGQLEDHFLPRFTARQGGEV